MSRSVVWYLVGKILQVEALLLMCPFVVSIIYQEDSIHQFGYLGVAVGLALIGFLFSYKKPKVFKIYARDGIVTVALSWILLSFFGALPLFFTGEIPNLVDGFFEIASGFTTTGSSILGDLSLLQHSSLFWRSFTHLIGGMGVLVFTLAILPSDSDSVQLMRAEVPGPVFGKLVSKLSQTARILYAIYLVMTAIMVVILCLVKVPLFDSLLLAFGTAGTGGFGIHNAGLTIYENAAAVEWIIGVGMLLFGVNFNLYYFLLLGKAKDVFQDEEFRWYIGIVAVATLFIFVNTWFTMSESVPLRSVFYTVSSIITTTGYSTADFNQWPVFSHVILLALMFIGGCAGSTAGGLKVSRIVIYVKRALSELKIIAQPNRVVGTFLSKRPITNDVQKQVASYLFVYLLMFVGILLSVSLEAPDFTTAFSSVAATFNNIGPGLAAVGPTSNFSFYSDINKFILAIGMIAGRLELYPILILFAPRTLKKMCVK